MEKLLSFKEWEKVFSGKRHKFYECLDKYPDNLELSKFKVNFDETYKIVRKIMSTPISKFPNPDDKRFEIYRLFTELNQIEENLKKETEIKNDSLPTVPEMKKETEIKTSRNKKASSKKKAIEIKEEQMKMDLRGGVRHGAGRPSLGKKKPVSITLSENEWTQIDDLIKEGQFKSYADYFRYCSRAAGVISDGE